MKSTMTVSEVSGLLRESSLCIPEVVLVRSVMVSCEVALALAACSAFLLLQDGLTNTWAVWDLFPERDVCITVGQASVCPETGGFFSVVAVTKVVLDLGIIGKALITKHKNKNRCAC